MGGNVSNTRAVVDTVNTLNVEKRNEIRNSCIAAQTGSNVQSYVADGAGSVVNMTGSVTQENVMQNVCLFKAILKSMGQNDSTAKAASDMIKKQDAGLFGLSASNTDTYTRLEQVTNIRELVSIVNESIQKANVSNAMSAGAFAGGVVNISGAIVQSNAAFNTNLAKSLTELESNTDMSGVVETTTTETQAAGLSMPSLPSPAKLAIIAAVVVALMVVYKRSRNNDQQK